MKLALELGGIRIEINSERDLPVSSMLEPFIDQCRSQQELVIYLTWDWEHTRHPRTLSVGEDLLQKYYREDRYWFCEAKGGKAPVTCTCYTEDFTWMECAINEAPFLEPPNSIERFFQFLPMRAVFLHFRTLLLHASQVSVNGIGIVFSASSGTGKTTQAKLWQTYMNAEYVCNDRTLLRKKNNIWQTYGYPIDGSEPVRSNAVNRLGCIVLLKQGMDNHVIRLRPGQAAGLLMEQVVMDCWNVQARMQAMELLLALLQDIPVYQQICTPDRAAVETLKNKLIREGVIADGANSQTSLG